MYIIIYVIKWPRVKTEIMLVCYTTILLFIFIYAYMHIIKWPRIKTEVILKK